MCGIAGIVTRNRAEPPREVLQKLADALKHRGPDGYAIHVRGGVGFVHTRLAIIDLATGDQPLIAEDGAALIANAEIYNDLELRTQLDPAFKTNSDCESALHLYRRDGEGFARGLRGMYAIAIHDPAKNQVVLARDPFGIKPLYVAETEIGLCFTSEPQALIAAGLVQPRINAAARDEVLALQFTTRSAFEGIERVAPGETLVIEQGRITQRLKIDALVSNGSTDFEKAWADSIHLHRRADVPYGMFLSGGIDSSAVLAMMARQEQRPVVAYTAAFPKTAAHDERELARRVAKHFGARHEELEITAFDFWKRLPRIVAAMDDPVADYAVIPSYLLAERAKHDVKVILTGEGGDELFAGYGRYRSALRSWPFRKQPWSRSALAGLGVLRTEPHWRAGLDEIESTIPSSFDALQKVQALDIRSWLPDDLLLKVDRCLMAHGIEGRVPLLDPAVTAAAFHLPRARKINKGLGKWALREWLAAAMPGYPAFERKRGFSVPVGEWIATQGLQIAPLVAAQPGIAEACVPERVEALFRDAAQGQAQWLLLFYALWHNRHILGRSPKGDVFDVLGAKH
jgi:asparagine synthase (glutamine-hydrolysing)